MSCRRLLASRCELGRCVVPTIHTIYQTNSIVTAWQLQARVRRPGIESRFVASMYAASDKQGEYVTASSDPRSTDLHPVEWGLQAGLDRAASKALQQKITELESERETVSAGLARRVVAVNHYLAVFSLHARDAA